jgi:hypothetical protein
MRTPKAKKATKAAKSDGIPPELPKEQLHKLMFRHSEEEAQKIRDYVEWQSRRDKSKVLHAEKVASERVMGREYDVWDVHTNEKGDNRWWVVTSPTNLYSQRLMPSMDYVLSFHIGVMMRVEARREPAGTEAEQELLLVTNRKLVQAGEAFDAADEAEEFQAVGMHCRECLLALVRELSEGGDFDEGGELPKKSDFKAWADRIVGTVAAGGSAERVRSYLKKISDETWQITNWLTQLIFRILGIKKPATIRKRHLYRIDELVSNRNKIAHGEETADEIGRRYSRNEILQHIQLMQKICLRLIFLVSEHCDAPERYCR